MVIMTFADKDVLSFGYLKSCISWEISSIAHHLKMLKNISDFENK